MGALDGVRVVDFTRHMAGPYATLVLADHGADVIKVEALPGGDPTRRAGKDFVGQESAMFLLWNRGKRSVALDFRTPQGLEVISKLVAGADVVVENYRPGVADRIGIGYQAMAAINPGLVYCSVSAFGATGELREAAGTDPVVQAFSGVMSVTGEAGGEPLLVGVPVADHTGAMHAVQGILLALIARQRSGRGQLVEVPMAFALMTMLSTRLGSYWASGRDPQAAGSAHTAYAPYQVFQTADGSVMAGAWGGDSWPRFCAAIDRPELASDPRFASNQGRLRNLAQLIDLINPVLAARTTAQWASRFAAAGALFAPVLSISQALAHPHTVSAGFVQSVQHTTLGTIPQLAPPIRLSADPASIRLPPPLLGQHTVEVLGESGYDLAQIEGLLGSGIAAAWDPPRPSTGE